MSNELDMLEDLIKRVAALERHNAIYGPINISKWSAAWSAARSAQNEELEKRLRHLIGVKP